MKNHKWLWIGFGFFLSINQGYTVVLGTLSDGHLLGADVVMAMDIFMYLLLFLHPNGSANSRHHTLIMVTRALSIAFAIWTITGELAAIEPAAFRFGYTHFVRAILIFNTIISRCNTRNDAINLTLGVLYGLAFHIAIATHQWQRGPVVIPMLDIQNSWRASGAIGPPNAFGVYMIMTLPILVRIALFAPFKYKWFWRGLTVFAILTLMASYVRGAWLAFLAVMVLFFLLDSSRRKLRRNQIWLFLAVSIVGTIGISFQYGEKIAHRFHDASESLAGDESHSRLSMAKDAIRIWKENKIFGIGLNNYRYHAEDDLQGTRIVHNAYLLVLTQQGLPGFLLFLILHIIVLFNGFRLLKIRDPVLYHIGVGAFSGYIAMLIYHFIAPDYRIIPVLMNHYRLLAFIPAMLVVNENTEKMMRRRKLARRRRRLQNYPQLQRNLPVEQEPVLPVERPDDSRHQKTDPDGTSFQFDHEPRTWK